MEKKSFSSFWKLRIKPDKIGLTDDFKGRRKRILDKQGNMNILRKGIKGDLFHRLVIIPLWQFLIWMLIFYIGVNLVFASVYFYLGPTSLGFDPEMNSGRYFLNCIYFSAQTITTVGYGAINPASDAANIIASLEALSGWMVFAIITGLVYGRFTLPKAGIAFSRHALINTKGQHPMLQCRIAGNMKGILMEIEAKMMISWIEKFGNEDKRVYMQLPLETSAVYMLSLSWTLSHKIDEVSPLWGKSGEDLKNANAEIMVMVKAENELYLQTIHDQTSYISDEIIWDARFKHTHEINSEGETIFYLSRLDDYELLAKDYVR